MSYPSYWSLSILLLYFVNYLYQFFMSFDMIYYTYMIKKSNNLTLGYFMIKLSFQCMTLDILHTKYNKQDHMYISSKFNKNKKNMYTCIYMHHKCIIKSTLLPLDIYSPFKLIISQFSTIPPFCQNTHRYRAIHKRK